MNAATPPPDALTSVVPATELEYDFSPKVTAVTPGQVAFEAREALRVAIVKRVGCTAPNGPCETCGRIVSGYMDLADIYAKAADDAQDARPAPDALRALLDIIAAVDHLDEPGPAADYIRLLAEYGLGEAAHPGDSTEPKPAPELAAAMREAASKELTAAMAESRGYREALQQVAKHHDDAIAQVRIIAKIAKRALEGK